MIVVGMVMIDIVFTMIVMVGMRILRMSTFNHMQRLGKNQKYCSSQKCSHRKGRDTNVYDFAMLFLNSYTGR
jgi:hypothetical protein